MCSIFIGIPYHEERKKEKEKKEEKGLATDSNANGELTELVQCYSTWYPCGRFKKRSL